MNKEFNLSEEIEIDGSYLKVWAVKEFIKLLEDKADVKIAEHTMDIGEDLLTIKRKDLHKLAGEELVENEAERMIAERRALKAKRKELTNHSQQDASKLDIYLQPADTSQGCGHRRPTRLTFCQLFKNHKESHQAVIY